MRTTRRNRRKSRWRNLIGDITNDLGGADNISEAERVLIRRAAMMTLQAELMEQRFSQNEDGAASSQQIECYGRTTNTLRRTLEALGLERRAKTIIPTLSDYLEAKKVVPTEDTVA